MWTETYGQLIDRVIITQLKAWHYTQDDKREAAGMAAQQVVELCEALDRYYDDCANKRVLPRIQKHLRYHDHNKVEAWRDGKQATPKAPDTISECIVALVNTHSDYWYTQSRIQILKALIDKTIDERERTDFERELIHLQRQHIDLDNQYRNELIQQIDQLFTQRISSDRS